MNTDIITAPIPASDVSKKILDTIFGAEWDNLSQATNGTVSQESASLILSLLHTFNTIALAAVAFLILYVATQGVIGTAHEGEALGKRHSTLWTPLRSAFSVSLLAPLAKGLSMLQILLLVSIGGSVNLANYAWQAGLDFLRDNAGQAVVHAPPAMRDNAREVARGVLSSLAVQFGLALHEGYAWSSGNVFEARWVPPAEANEPGAWVYQFRAPSDRSGEFDSRLRDEYMGSVVIPCANQDDSVCQARLSGISAMVSSLIPSADQIARIARVNDQPPVAKFQNHLEDAVDAYLAAVRPALSQIISESDSERATELDEFVDAAKADGWLLAGSYYWTISRFIEHDQARIARMPQYMPIAAHKIERDLYDVALVQSLVGGVEAAADEKWVHDRMEIARNGGDSWMQPAVDMLRNVMGSMGLVAVTQAMAGGDTVESLSSLGHGILSGVEVAFVSYLGAVFVASGADAVASEGVWGGLAGIFSGDASTFLAAGTVGVLKILLGILILAVLPLYTLGLLLAYYLPALPFVLWISAVVGWLILVVESLVAAPLWAAAHALPEGEGMAGQHGRQGYTLFLGILARPPLMILGFFFAVMLIGAIGQLVGNAFLIYAGAAEAEYVPHLRTTLVMAFLIGGLLVVIAHKIFGLITHLPDTVLRWIGQHVQNLGEHQDEGRVRGIVAGAVGKTEGVTAGAAGRASGLGKAKPGGSGGDSGETAGKGLEKDLESGDAAPTPKNFEGKPR